MFSSAVIVKRCYCARSKTSIRNQWKTRIKIRSSNHPQHFAHLGIKENIKGTCGLTQKYLTFNLAYFGMNIDVLIRRWRVFCPWFGCISCAK